MSASLQSCGSDHSGLPGPRRYYAAAAIMAGILMGSLDTSIVNIALPTITTSLNVHPSRVVWVANSYQVASAVSMMAFAAMARMFGQRRVYAAGLFLFTIASLGCALSGSIGVLVLTRTLQGFGYAAMVTIGLGLYRKVFPPQSLATVLGWNALVVSAGMTAGPIVGGLIVAYLSWQWLFLINLPLGTVALCFALRSLPPDTWDTQSFDLPGALLSASSMCALVVGVDQLGQWPSNVLILVFLSGGLLGALFIRQQTRSRHPLLPLDIFHSRRFTFAVVASICMFASQGLAMVALPFFLQETYHFSALQSSLIFIPWPLAVVLIAPMSGKLTGRIGAPLLAFAGVTTLAIGLMALAVLPSSASVTDILWRLAICGVGYGLFLPPNNSEMLGNVPVNRASAASGVLSTAKSLGQSIGAAFVAVVAAMTATGSSDFVHLAFGIASATALLSCAVSVYRIFKTTT